MSASTFMKKPGRTLGSENRDRRPTAIGRVKSVLVFFGRILKAIVFWPFRAIAALRRSVTTASVGLMLLSLMALNIVWGYPWVGMLAVCMSLLLVGWAISWLTQPKLQVGCNLPRHAVVGQALTVKTHMLNTRSLPALDVSVGFGQHSLDRRRRRKRSAKLVDGGPWRFFSLIRSGHAVQDEASLTYHRRGVHALPPLAIQSTFPFYLYRNLTFKQFDETIAITPAPLDSESDVVARSVLSAIGNWTERVLSGAALDYAGSREYQVGMPVRRWDFASWARLGKPIVREFQSPSRSSLTMIIDTAREDTARKDTARDDAAGNDGGVDEAFEYLLSLTASAIGEFAASSIGLELYLTSEPSERMEDAVRSYSQGSEQDAMMVRLAGTEQVDASLSNQRIEEVIETIGRSPAIMLTRRNDSVSQFADDITIVTVDSRGVHVSGPEQSPVRSRQEDT